MWYVLHLNVPTICDARCRADQLAFERVAELLFVREQGTADNFYKQKQLLPEILVEAAKSTTDASQKNVNVRYQPVSSVLLLFSVVSLSLPICSISLATSTSIKSQMLRIKFLDNHSESENC